MLIHPTPSNQGERGFSYMMLMIAIVLMGVAMSVAARQWKTMVQRELEADLLGKGIEIQNALALYSASKKAGRVMLGEVYPQTLADLTRLPKPFLRKAYLDPVGHGEWEVVRARSGGIMGVRSRSRSRPIRQTNFPLAVRHFEGKPTYYDWVFQFRSSAERSISDSAITGQKRSWNSRPASQIKPARALEMGMAVWYDAKGEGMTNLTARVTYATSAGGCVLKRQRDRVTSR